MAKISKKQLLNLTPDEQLYIKAKEAYYAGNPIMEDEEFDALEDNLRELDSFVLDIVGSPKKRKNMIQHVTPMGSLAKIKFENNYVPFKEFSQWLKDKSYEYLILEPKFDGNAINCIYADGQLVHVLSRGDGLEGQEYKDKIKVPQQIKGFTGEIRGEAVIDTEIFNIKYKKEEGNDDPSKVYKNDRNYVAGTLGGDFDRKDIQKYSEIDFLAFDIVNFDGDIYKNLIKWGFTTTDFKLKLDAISSEDELHTAYKQFIKFRNTSKYQLDGIVCKTDEKSRSEIGSNSNHPLWALAIKFVAEKVRSKIIDIRWTLGKTGQLTPTAILEPVELMGSTVQRASVYNAQWMLDKKCYPGAVVSLVKSGDIIPKIVDIISPSEIDYILPTEWEGMPVHMTDVHLMLDNFEESDQFKSIKLYNAIAGLGFKGIGPATAEQLNSAGLGLNDLLSESPESLANRLISSGKFKLGRELELLVENIFELQKVEFWQLIYAQQFRNCGETASKQLAKWHCKMKHNFAGLEKAVIEKYVNSEEDQNRVNMLAEILKNSNVEIVEPRDTTGILTFEMTGDCGIPGHNKSSYKVLIEQTGKFIHSSLNKDTNYLVTASMASMTGKMIKAEKNGTKIMTYESFLEYARSI